MLFTGGSISKGSLSSFFLWRCHISQNEGKLFKFMAGRNADCLAREDDAGVVREAMSE